MSVFSRLKAWAFALKRDVLALWIAGRDSRTPVLAKALAAAVAAYALSPIDLIPISSRFSAISTTCCSSRRASGSFCA